jgi:hypothetical protein
MNPRTQFGKIFLAVFALGMGLMLCPRNAAAFSLKNADIDQIVHSGPNFTLNALVMEVNFTKGYLVVGEKRINLMDFKAKEEYYKTAFINLQGDKFYAASVKTSQYKGKRVLVTGYRLASGNIVAESIQRVELRRK